MPLTRSPPAFRPSGDWLSELGFCRIRRIGKFARFCRFRTTPANYHSREKTIVADLSYSLHWRPHSYPIRGQASPIMETVCASILRTAS